MQFEFDQGPPGPGRRESVFHVGAASRAVARPDRRALAAAEDLGRQTAQGGGPDGTRGYSKQLGATDLYSIALRFKQLWDIYDAVWLHCITPHSGRCFHVPRGLYGEACESIEVRATLNGSM